MEQAIKEETEGAIELTESAAAQIKRLLAVPDNEGKALRLAVEQGGCSGMQYSMSFDTAHPDDQINQALGVSILTDAFSAPYLQGIRVDYSDALIGGGFKISNPNARKSCGCGKSFAA